MTRPALVALVATSLLLLAGCAHHEFHHHEVAVHPHPGGHGPPPHAPAHGYRHKNRGGLELVYDSGLGVYAVAGWDGTYFHEDHYLRYHGGNWQHAVQLRGPWSTVASRALPPGLKRLHSDLAVHPASAPKNRGNGHGAAKPAW
ncbi:MAG TPA: hypothetical protein VM285_08850 [Polyangia bacterium]|nr:hypothetical protein [Polyangia bacterium]